MGRNAHTRARKWWWQTGDGAEGRGRYQHTPHPDLHRLLCPKASPELSTNLRYLTTDEMQSAILNTFSVFKSTYNFLLYLFFCFSTAIISFLLSLESYTVILPLFINKRLIYVDYIHSPPFYSYPSPSLTLIYSSVLTT